jgi:protein tyrosine phosphatase
VRLDQGKQQCDYSQRWIRTQHPTLFLYAIRHAWAVRSIAKVPSTSLAAKCMGHTVSVHHSTYHRWLDQADIAAVAAAAAALAK